MQNEERLDPGFWLGLVAIIILLFITMRCDAQRQVSIYDTIPCKINCIAKFITEPTAKGGERIYAVYNDLSNDVSDLIPVSQSVYKYIRLCEQNGVTPKLGIKLRNHQVSSIIKYKKAYAINKRKDNPSKEH